MRILGISAFYHDSAAALVVDGRIVAAAQEERFTRKKHDARFPELAIASCLQEGGVTLADVDYVVFYEKPFLKFERLLETYVAFAPRGFQSFAMAIPVWIRDKLFGAIIPDAIVERLQRAADPAAEGRRICIDIVRELADVPHIAGVHIMAPGNESTVPDIITAARETIARLAAV